MSAKLKAKLEEDLPGKVSVECVPVDPNGPQGKVYKISIGGEPIFDWAMAGPPPPKVNVAPNESWQTPLNFDTHSKYFGPGAEEEGGEKKKEMYEYLKKTIAERAG
mmetsp:Transcript_120118/g.339936  ORF Transcript_120118/g.339936 Transcript_120118/m.339936 type:complete len:106 (+) Transcript_120118:158-475(+)|eukprot:CAMPEP_0117525330 /NCGR_PEP_ID=MMETSP0784-20121206/35713_1 /TAXON_ID=39447 /ORGANISM="" /LENGTH=105 /DNA_ID=CAMNT_0005321521 /DNA_START=152 /DNA_END=469 /DNA_ORIENTATION=-